MYLPLDALSRVIEIVWPISDELYFNGLMKHNKFDTALH